MVSLTSLTALLALAASAPAAPAIQSDYARAVALAQEQHKPIVVFISAGASAIDPILTEGSLSDVAQRRLTRDYVCLHVDPSTPEGISLAQQFQMTQGLVISDRTAGLQALRHEGKISPELLNQTLETFAKPELVVRTTVQQGQVPAVVPAAAPVVTAPVITPATATYYPGSILSNPGYPVYRAAGSCPNGRCPNAR